MNASSSWENDASCPGVHSSYASDSRKTSNSRTDSVDSYVSLSRTQSIPDYKSRSRLPSIMVQRNQISLWTILKQSIGKELSKITMPVVFNEPISFLQRLCEYMEYSFLIDRATEEQDPVRRMEYVAAFAVSSLASNADRLSKPFNPLLGETYQIDRLEDLGFRIVCEQVSHHPPVSAFHADSPNFRFYGSIYPKLRFWGTSVEIQPKGLITLQLPSKSRQRALYGTWTDFLASCQVSVFDEKFPMWNKGGKGKALHKNFSTNTVPNSTGMDGEQNQELNCSKNCSEAQLKKGGAIPVLSGSHVLWRVNPRPPDSEEYYHFTLFALMLNDLNAECAANLPPTDSRLRPDIRSLEDGDCDQAANEKHRLEEKQRESRARRKKTKDDWAPLVCVAAQDNRNPFSQSELKRWFEMRQHPELGERTWAFANDYWSKNWSKCPDIFWDKQCAWLGVDPTGRENVLC